MYGTGVDTPLLMKYGDGDFDKQPEVINGDGDGTVNAFSLKLCQRWTEDGAQTRSAKIMEFPKVTHSGMLTDESVLKALYKEVGIKTKTVELEQKFPEIQV